MSASHTPGPWSIHYNREGYAYIGGPNWGSFARVVTAIEDGANEIPSPEGEANARLIAAAPDLLALMGETYDALHRWVDEAKGNDNEWSRRIAIRHDVRALLARIDGRTA